MEVEFSPDKSRFCTLFLKALKEPLAEDEKDFAEKYARYFLETSPKVFTATLNGYYGEDFKEKQEIIRELLVDKNVDYKSLDKLMNGELSKFCSPRLGEFISENKKNGKYFWYCW